MRGLNGKTAIVTGGGGAIGRAHAHAADIADYGAVEAAGAALEAFRRATPMRRLGLPGDHPGVVAFLASDDADFITGQVISVSGGLTMNG